MSSWGANIISKKKNSKLYKINHDELDFYRKKIHFYPRLLNVLSKTFPYFLHETHSLDHKQTNWETVTHCFPQFSPVYKHRDKPSWKIGKYIHTRNKKKEWIKKCWSQQTCHEDRSRWSSSCCGQWSKPFHRNPERRPTLPEAVSPHSVSLAYFTAL